MKILTVSLIVAGLLATTGIASADRRRHDRRDRWEQRNEVRWHRPARRVIVAPVVRVAPPRVIVRHQRFRAQPRVIVVQPPPPPPPVYVVQPYPPAPVYVPPPSDDDCDHDDDNYDYDNGYQDYNGDGYDDDGYNNYSAPVQPSGVSAGVRVRIGS
jgi:hypothetical protein